LHRVEYVVPLHEFVKPARRGISEDRRKTKRKLTKKLSDVYCVMVVRN